MSSVARSTVWGSVWFTVLALSCLCHGQVIYVDTAAVGANDGSSWQNACKYLQDALAAATAAATPVEIRLAQGVYKPDQGAGVTGGDQAASFQLLNGVTLKGGYAGVAGPDPDARDISLSATILSGDLTGNDSNDLQSGRDDSCHVLTGHLIDSTAVMDGLTVTGGKWTLARCGGGPRLDTGASVVIDAGSPTIRDCHFTGNRGLGRQAVIFLSNASAPTFTGCVFSDNDTGIEIAASNPTLVNCLFTGNRREAMLCDTNSVVSVTDCRFEANMRAIDGSGNARLTLADCTFIDNSLAVEGWSGSVIATHCVFERNKEGIRMLPGDLTLTDCKFEGNKHGAVSGAGDAIVMRCSFTGNTGGLAGAIESYVSLTASDCTFTANTGMVAGAILGSGVLTLRNCEFIGNSGKRNGAVDASGEVLRATGCLFTGNSGEYGGALSSHAALFSLSNCTFADNRGTPSAIRHDRPGSVCPAAMTQCILWDGPSALRQESPSHEAITVTYSNIQGGYEGQGNIDADPCFIALGHWADPQDPSVVLVPEDSNAVWVPGDYHLKSQAGHWDRTTETWLCDDVTSVCIDAGDPNGPVGSEPFPNGGFVNMGAYGGTVEASRSYFGGPICETQIAGDINGDCVVDDTDMDILTSHWLQQGWPPTDLPPTITITQPKDGDEFNVATPVSIRADAADPDGSVVRVVFHTEYRYASGMYGTGTTDSDPSNGWGWEWRWPSRTGTTTPQTWTIWAEAMDDDGNVTVSPKIKVTIHVTN